MNDSCRYKGASFAIGVDVGGTKINIALVDRHGNTVLENRLPTESAERNVLEKIVSAIELVMDQAGNGWAGMRPCGIGVGSAGQIDWATGAVRGGTALMPGYTGTPIKQMLEQRFGLPVFVDNDVNVMALTEKYLGAGRNKRHFLCLALGTGIGGAIVVDGKLVHGAWGAAGEIGHMSVRFDGRKCICGSFGCLEQYASGTGIAAMMNEQLSLRMRSTTPVDARETLLRWMNGDEMASQVMDEAIAALGSGISSLIHIFNPEAVVIGGGIAEAGDKLFERLRKEIAARTMSSILQDVEIKPAYRGNWSGAIGAALQVWEYGVSP